MQFITVMLSFILGIANMHPMYISLALVDYNPKTQSLDITLKVFTDDLQDAIRKQSQRDDLYIGYDDELAAVDSLIQVYFNEALKFIPNEETTTSEMAFIGKEIELDVTWCYFQINDIQDIKKLQSHCSIFTELFPSQTTIMHVKRNGKEKSMLFNRERKDQAVQFEP
jgi:hypothetical protein